MVDARALATAAVEPLLSPLTVHSAPAPRVSRSRDSRQWLWKGIGGFAVLLLFYTPLLELSRRLTFTTRIAPKPAATTPLDQFSEERAMAHVVRLATDIGIRQEGSEGLDLGRAYILDEVRRLKAKASPRLRFEIDDSRVSGSFHMNFLFRSLTLAYQNLSNVVVRVSDASLPVDASPSILLNAHYDSPLGSPGAADCASCVATLLEALRAMAEGGKVPRAPVIFLFNGAEEVFLKGVHGFVTKHPWSETVGAFMNFESSGSSLPDLVIQSGPVMWPNRVYAESAVHPSATVITQDFFPHVPGDTDFRIVSKDFDDVPGMDFMIMLRGYFYHTPYDVADKIMPGVLQMRGENLLPLLEGLAAAPELKTRQGRREAAAKGESNADQVPVFFDLFNHVSVFYPRHVAMAGNAALLGALYLVPWLTSPAASGYATVAQRCTALASAAFAQALTWLMAFVVPVLVAVGRIVLSGKPLAWYSSPNTAFVMFVPAAIIGTLLPHVSRAGGSWSKPALLSPQQEVAFCWSAHWGGLMYFVSLAMIVTLCGGGGGYIGVWWSLSLLPSLFIYNKLQKMFGHSNPIALLGYLLPAAVPCAYCINFSAFYTFFMAEKMGASGAAPLPWGLFVPDIVLACFIGIAVCIIVAPFAPILSRWIARPAFLRALLLISVVAAAHICTLFPYSTHAPKRVVMQRVYTTHGGSVDGEHPPVTRAETTIATADCNDAAFLLATIPGLQAALAQPGNHSAMTLANKANLRALYPISDLIDRSFTFPAPPSPRLSSPGFRFPSIQVINDTTMLPPAPHHSSSLPLAPNGTTLPQARRRLHLEVHAGSLDQVWASVLNITGPVTAWSLTPTLPPREVSRGGPPSLMVHYNGGGPGFKWQFWVELAAGQQLNVELAVLDQVMDDDVSHIASVFPPWVALTASSSYISYHSL
ncbi:unnamed protein product [Closterium sp. NIES-64]|nr:unnamed protein product [Closterium sp. NIES-64]